MIFKGEYPWYVFVAVALEAHWLGTHTTCVPEELDDDEEELLDDVDEVPAAVSTLLQTDFAKLQSLILVPGCIVLIVFVSSTIGLEEK